MKLKRNPGTMHICLSAVNAAAINSNATNNLDHIETFVSVSRQEKKIINCKFSYNVNNCVWNGKFHYKLSDALHLHFERYTKNACFAQVMHLCAMGKNEIKGPILNTIRWETMQFVEQNAETKVRPHKSIHTRPSVCVIHI